jgi:hypothetical protein
MKTIINPIRTIRQILLLAAMVFTSGKALAQQEKQILSDNPAMGRCLQQTKFDIDSTAQAVILYEKGYAIMEGGDISYTIERIVKILSKEAIEYFGTIDIAKGRDVRVMDIDATTYNLEGGQIIKQSVNRSDIFKDKVTKGVVISKFNLPSLKIGSVIHYTYTISQSGYTIPDWTFQNNYPTLCSEYEISVPDYVVYTALQRINVPLKAVKRKKEMETCTSCSFTESFGKGQPVYATWIRRNVPAFKEEPYMSSNDNYLESIKIRITAIIDDGIVKERYKNWDEFCKKYYYKDNEFCGQAFNNNNFLKEKVDELTRGKTTELDKAKAIFSYIRSNFTPKESGPGSGADIKDVFASRQGSAAGINLLLSAMLRKAGLNSAPVLLATKSAERLSQFYPDNQSINYVASKVQADKKEYFLDASGRYMPFGTLPPFCYNGYCRVISEEGGFAILNPDSIKNKTVVIATLAQAADKGKLLLKSDYQFGVMSGMNYRRKWHDDSVKVKADFQKQLKAFNASATLASYRFINLDQPDELLKLHYEAIIELSENADMVYFNPYFEKFFEQNPFSANNRTYPIEMDYQSDLNYIFNFTLPPNYTVDDYPKSALIKFGSNNLLTMKNIMNYDETEKQFSINSRFTTQATVFGADGYSELRNFFGHVIEEQNKKIVLKKLP